MIYKVMSRQTIPDVSASIGFTAANIPPAERRTIYALVQAVGGNLRYCIDGSTPSDTLGLRLTQDSTMEVWGAEALRDFRCKGTGGGTISAEVVYMGRGGLE